MAIKIPPPPPPPDKAKSRKPLGVPEGYTAERVEYVDNPDQFGPGEPLAITRQAQPRYFDGAEFVPARLGPEKIARIQSVLAQVGLIGPKTAFRLGVWDETSRNAYKNLLEFANSYGVDESEALDLYSQSVAVRGDGATAGVGGGLPRTKLSNPEDLAAVVDTVARARIGRKVDDGFTQRFISAYQQAEQAEAAAAMGEGGTYTGAPDARVMAENMLETEYADDAAQMDALETGNEFFQLLTSERVG